MIQMITDILNIYVAMVIYYVMKLPYVLRTIFAVIVGFFIINLIVKIVFLVLKKCIVPIVFLLIKSMIQILQTAIFLIVKVIPDFQNIGSDLDEILNLFGIKLEEWNAVLKNRTQKSNIGKKLWWGGFSILLVVTLVFVVIPYYMEPSLTGNAKNICVRLNKFNTNFEKDIYSYVNQYYTPAVSNESFSYSQKEEESSEVRKHILHLGKEGYNGANLRSTPELKKGNVIKVVSGDIELFYENDKEHDGERYWLKVSTEDVAEAWISKKLIRNEDLEAAGIEK